MPFFVGFVNVESVLNICCELVDFCEFCSKENGFFAGKYFDAPAANLLAGFIFLCYNSNILYYPERSAYLP